MDPSLTYPQDIANTYSRLTDPDESLHGYLHGYVSSRIMNEVPSATGNRGLPVSIAATRVDGLVLSLAPNSHNYNYRSAILQGHARLVERTEEKLYAMQLITESVVADRWQNSRVPPVSAEMQSTSILRVQVTGGSSKIRYGGVTDLTKDYRDEQVTARVWTGVIPIWVTTGEPIPSDDNKVHPVPDYLSSYITACNEKGQGYARGAVQVPLPKGEGH